MKKFLIIGNMNAVTHMEVIPLIKDNKVWFGVSKRSMDFIISDNGDTVNVNARWFTNLEHNKRPKPLDLTQTYSADIYPKYDNYDAINVDKTKDIPKDYYGVMGVPITFLDKYCPEQFEIIGVFNWFHKLDEEKGQICGTPIGFTDKNGKTIIWNGPTVNNKPIYKRILIRLKK